MNEFLKEKLGAWIYDPMVGKLATAFFAVAVVITLFHYLRRALTTKIEDSARRYRVRKAITFLGYLVATIIVISVFSDRLSRLTVVFGVAGAGIAFALQEVIASIAGWFAINFGNFFSTGDRVQLGGIKGDVIDVNMLRTTVMECGAWVDGDLYNGRIVRIANSYVFKEPVYNYSGDFEFLWDEMVIPIRPGTDTDQVQTILKEIAQEVVGDYSIGAKKSWGKIVKKYLIEDAQIEPMITAALAIDRVNFTLRYVVEYKKRRLTKHELTTRILARFQNADPPITLAPTAVEIDRVPALQIQPN